MSKTTVKTRCGRELVLPSDEENTAILDAARSDPDAQPWSKEQLETIRHEARFSYGSKTRINIRVNNRTLAAFKERAAKDGENYQTLMNEALDEFLRGAALADVVRNTIREELRSV